MVAGKRSEDPESAPRDETDPEIPVYDTRPSFASEARNEVIIHLRHTVTVDVDFGVKGSRRDDLL